MIENNGTTGTIHWILIELMHLSAHRNQGILHGRNDSEKMSHKGVRQTPVCVFRFEQLPELIPESRS